jgi:hypothetical protein
MKGRVAKKELGGILVQAKCAAKNIRAQRERLLHFHLQLQQNQADAPPEEVVSGLIHVYCEGLEAGARYLTACLTMTAQSGEPPSLPLDFALISDEQLFARLLALRLPRRPVSQAQAFARLEAAFYAVTLNLRYCLTRCIDHLGHPKCADTDQEELDDEAFQVSPPDTDDEYLQDGGEFGPPDTVAAATKDIAKIALSDPGAAATDTGPSQQGSKTVLAVSEAAAATEDCAKIGLTDQDAVATDHTYDSAKTNLSNPATGETPQAPIIDMNQARTYLNHACTLADLALKHVDLAVTAISSCLDPAQVASICAFADNVAYTN